ncbi:MAG: DUF1287 domain-containing protein [Halocynthiibacter sp.]
MTWFKNIIGLGAFVTGATFVALQFEATRGFALIAKGYASQVVPEALTPTKETLEATAHATALIEAAEAQIGVTLLYDGSYVGLDYPMGDVPRLRGVCSDVVIRAFRDGHGVDLQQAVHEDMKQAFGTYPKIWGLKSTDRNIDHRRVPNLETYFTRQNMRRTHTQNPADYLPGDLVTWRLPGNLPHIGIVSDELSFDGTPLILHNIGAGTRRDNILFAYEISGHFRPRVTQMN